MALASAYVASLVDLGYSPVKRLTSFPDNVTVSGNEYEGGKVLNVERLTLAKGVPDRRLTLRLAAIAPADLALYLADHGPVSITIQWLASSDGSTWTLLPVRHVGRQSGMLVTAGTAEIQVETARGTLWAGQPRMYSDADQQERFPGDKAFEYVQRLRLEGIQVHPPS